MEYKDTTKKIPEIAKELGVANILEGGVQRSGNHVRINVQLIDAETDEHLWAQIYDRELTAENLFAIQSEVAQSIATALQATLSPDEAASGGHNVRPNRRPNPSSCFSRPSNWTRGSPRPGPGWATPIVTRPITVACRGMK